jgi:hypothetical protein
MQRLGMVVAIPATEVPVPVAPLLGTPEVAQRTPEVQMDTVTDPSFLEDFIPRWDIRWELLFLDFPGHLFTEVMADWADTTAHKAWERNEKNDKNIKFPKPKMC